jgi:MFS family permease
MLLAGYYILRPLRDRMGIAGGVNTLPWMFTATFVTLLVMQPLYGALVAKLPRARFIAVVYHFFVANLALFWLLLTLGVAPVIVARVFFVWVSVFSLFAVAVFWSFMADLFDSEQGKRLFGFIGAGGTAGSLLGPLITIGLSVPLGPVNLLIAAIVLLELAVFCVHRLASGTRTRTRPRAGKSLMGRWLKLRLKTRPRFLPVWSLNFRKRSTPSPRISGPIGANAANKAANIYATYLETDGGRKREIFLKSAERAEELQAAAPGFVNAFYFHAQALGRYAQEISIVKALAQGIGGRVKASLDKALKLEPNHADAHIALGTYQAEIVSKVGGMLASLTYGASKEEAMKHFALARKLLPDLAIARIEEANGLVMLFGKAKLAEAEKLYKEAGRCKPAGAMQKLDAEHAREEADG